MSSALLQYEVEKNAGKEKRGQSLQGTKGALPDEKLIEALQICIGCRKQFPFKQGRRSCPHCCGLLIVKIRVLKET